MAGATLSVSIKTFIRLLAVVLVASLALNAWLLLSEGPPHTSTASAPTEAATSVQAPKGAPSTYRPDEIIECRQKLELCERRRKLGPLTLGTFRGASKRRDGTEPEAHHNEEFLCTLARAQIEQAWIERKDEIVFVLRNTLANEAVQEHDVSTAVDRYAEGLGLSDEERVRFEERYRDARLERIDTIRDALDEDPPDFTTILAEVQSLHEDEDRLTNDMFGPEAEQWLQESEREARGSLLAIAATYAEVPWEEVID